MAVHGISTLQNIVKNYDKAEEGYEVLVHALDQMTGRAQHINEMKRKHEHAVRVQEIQSTLEEYEGEDLTTLGELVLEVNYLPLIFISVTKSHLLIHFLTLGISINYRLMVFSFFL